MPVRLSKSEKPLEILIGADPEVWCLEESSGKIVSAHGMIPGDKRNPSPVKDGAIQVDGLALEFNITPCWTANQFSHTVSTVHKQLMEKLPKGFTTVVQPTAEFDPVYFAGIPDDAKAIGCEPDWNAYTGEHNPRPMFGFEPYRCAGGHVHIGWRKDGNPYSENHLRACRRLAQQLDYGIGIWSLLWDKDSKRRTLYGKAGAFRPKPYGMEYRSLSNMWLTTANLRKYVFNWVHRSVSDMQAGVWYADEYGIGAAQKIINENLFDWPDLYHDIYSQRVDPTVTYERDSELQVHVG